MEMLAQSVIIIWKEHLHFDILELVDFLSHLDLLTELVGRLNSGSLIKVDNMCFPCLLNYGIDYTKLNFLLKILRTNPSKSISETGKIAE